MIVSGVVFRGGELLVMCLATSLQYMAFDMVLICYFLSLHNMLIHPTGVIW